MIWLLARELFARGNSKKEGWAFLTACLFAGGGLALTVGRLGLYLPMLAFFIVGSFYFMYRFFDRGLSEEKPAKSACNILVSGLLFALAVASDPKMLLAGVGIVALFIAGVVRLERQYRAKRQALRGEMRDANAKETSREVMLENAAAAEEKSAALGAELSYARRLVYLLFFAAFVLGSFLLIVLSAIPSYSALVYLYDPNPASATAGIFDLLGHMFGDAFSLTNATSFTAGNAVNAFGWFIGLKGATLFSATADGTYIALNAQVNLAMAVTALVGFLFLTAYTILYYVTGGHRAARVLRAAGGAGVCAAAVPLCGAGERGAEHAVQLLLPRIHPADLLHRFGAGHARARKAVRAHPHEHRKVGALLAARCVCGHLRAVASHGLLHPAPGGRRGGDVRLDDVCKQRLVPIKEYGRRACIRAALSRRSVLCYPK